MFFLSLNKFKNNPLFKKKTTQPHNFYHNYMSIGIENVLLASYFSHSVVAFLLAFLGLKEKVCGTLGSKAVTHPCTERALHCLTSGIGRELVLSVWYGRRH